MNPYEIIKKYYTEGSKLYEILVAHSQNVERKALEIAKKHPELHLNVTFLSEASLLHDIGIYLCYAPSIECYGTHQYIEHGYLGAHILLSEGLPLHSHVCERHTGTGISIEKIVSRKLPVPLRDMLPVTMEEKVICYADKFYSKSALETEHSIQYITDHLKKYGEEDVSVFMNWHEQFK